MKRVLITGASAGIGKATALRLAQPQRVLVLVARSEEGLKQVSQEIKKSCPSCVVEVHPLDLTDKIESRKFYESLAPLDGAVLNAGSGSAGTFLDQNNEQIASMINLNCLALTESCRYVGSAMKKKRGRATRIDFFHGRVSSRSLPQRLLRHEGFCSFFGRVSPSGTQK